MILLATYYKASNCLKTLLDMGVFGLNGIDAHGKNGETPLHLSCKDETGETTSVLLSYGADIDAVNNKGETAGHCSLKHDSGHKQLQYLVSYGLDLFVIDKRGDSIMDSYFRPGIRIPSAGTPAYEKLLGHAIAAVAIGKNVDIAELVIGNPGVYIPPLSK